MLEDHCHACVPLGQYTPLVPNTISCSLAGLDGRLSSERPGFDSPGGLVLNMRLEFGCW